MLYDKKDSLLRLFTLLSSISLSVAALAVEPTTKIVGGNEANSGEYPFIVSLQDSNGHFCGGSVISPTHILTAAHCKGGSYDAVIGLHDQDNPGGSQRIAVKKEIIHPNYSNGPYDMMVLELSEPINSSLYAPINLASNSDASAGTMTTAVGWGLTDKNANDLPSKLREVNLPIVSYAQCEDAYAAEGESINKTAELCAGYQNGGFDSCQGDSGGPLVLKKNGQFYQVGVVSWGIGCADPGFYGVYSHVPNLTSWIESKVPDLGDGGGDTGGGNGGSCYTNNVTLKLEMDKYGDETSWEIRNKNGNKVASGSGYNNYQSVSKNINLSDGDFTFTINDTYGDGMTVGNGSYELIDSKGAVIKSGGDFEKSESVSFCASVSDTGGGDTGGGDTGGNCFKSKVKLILQIDDYGYETDWKITDSSGKKLYSGGDYPANKTIKKKMSLSNGNYKFSILDSYGDGLTGKGKFKLRDDNKETIIKGSNFGDEASKNFCISN